MDDQQLRKHLRTAQKAEITEYHIYQRLAGVTRNPYNRQVLEDIARDELTHYNRLQALTGRDATPNRIKVWAYYLLARLLGLTFALRLLETKEGLAQGNYRRVSQQVPDLATLEKDEYHHEQSLLEMLDEERLRYASSMVLGVNDALVELTGVLAGFTLALQNTRLIALTGLVTGVSAALSMSASEYLSTKTEAATQGEPQAGDKHPLKAALYTGLAYSVAVVALVLPFFLAGNHFWALAWTMLHALLLILGFTYYLSVARGTSFTRSYLEMAGISLGVAAISFGLGLAVRHFLGVQV